MRRTFTHTRYTVHLKKAVGDYWLLYIEAYPILKADGTYTRKRYPLNRKISTPIWIDEDAPRRKPKRDENGVIQCRSRLDRDACLYADEVCRIKQAEFERELLYSSENASINELREAGEFDFVDYVEYTLSVKHAKSSESIRMNWKRLISLLRAFAADSNGVILFKELNTRLINKFKSFLLTAPMGGKRKGIISQNTAATYFSIFKAALKQAFVEGYLAVDLAAKTKGIPEETPQIEYLMPEEVENLINTPCANDTLKRAAIFSIYTGLRHCDIRKLTWSEIEEANGKYRLTIRQKKTHVPLQIPLSASAVKLCGPREEGCRRVFPNLMSVSWISKPLARWVKAAGIEKHITFHCMRHTFAVLQSIKGTSIHTISKMMGHTNVRTTQIYADIVDSIKEKAAEAFDFDLSPML